MIGILPTKQITKLYKLLQEFEGSYIMRRASDKKVSFRIMNQRTQYLLQSLEKIGAPLMAAIIETSKATGEQAAQQDAHTMAAMLGKAVQASIDLGQIMDVNPLEAQDDSLRVALAGLSAPLVAGQMRRAGGLPEDADLKRIVTAFQAVLTFSDNFAPNAENTQRLANIEATGQSVDPHQSTIQYARAFVPVIQAISVFSFGQSEQKLIVEVARRIVEKAGGLRRSLIPAINDEEAKPVELVFVAALASIYAACHVAQTQKTQEAENRPSLDAVWTGFDLQAAMLEVLLQSLVPGGVAQSTAASGGAKPEAVVATTPPPVQAPVQPPVAPPPPIAPQETPPPVAAPATPPAQAETSGAANPMSMFAKPKAGDAQAAAPPPTPPAAPPPVQAPPADPPAQTPPASEGGGGPMSFFKKEDE